MTREYMVHSCRVRVHGWPDVIGAVHARLEPFAAEGSAGCDVEVVFIREPDPSSEDTVSHRAGRGVYDFPNGEVAYDDQRDLLTITVGKRVRAVCDVRAGSARIAIDSPTDADVWLLSHPVLSVVLMEFLKRRGLFPVHAAGLSLDGSAVLLAGTSGAGKSTLSVALARRGFAFLADDTVYLKAEGSGWRVRSFPDQIDLCADATNLFPELRSLSTAARRSHWPKWQVRAETAFGAAVPVDASPCVLMFPSVCDTAESHLRPLAPAAALLALAPNVLLTDALASQRHLDALAGLVSQCACYRLDTGRDLDGAVNVVRAAMAS